MGRSDEYDRNQLAAKASWDKYFDQIVYLNDYEPELASPKTMFVPHEPFARICDIAAMCAAQTDWCCIINADIVLAHTFRRMEATLKRKSYEFDPNDGIDKGKVPDHDFGLDFFAAVPNIWKQVGEICPSELRHGCIRWDAWLLSFFNAVACSGFYSVTNHRCIFHPRHDGRKYGHEIPVINPVGPIYFPPELV
jgi:hypothetical protein